MQMPVDKVEYVSIPKDDPRGIEVPPGTSIQGLEKEVILLDKKTNFLWGIMVAIIFALFIGFASVLATLAGILTDAWRYNVNSYIDYQNSDKQMTQKLNDFEMRLQQIVEQVSAIKESRD